MLNPVIRGPGWTFDVKIKAVAARALSTNFYYHEASCPTCGHTPEPIHLGKSSVGWTFALKVNPEGGVFTLKDVTEWLTDRLGYLQTPATEWPKIIDENGQSHTLESFLESVTDRYSPQREQRGWDWDWFEPAYTSEKNFHHFNGSERGPRGLLRRQIDGVHCVGHGDGTWDYCTGEFS